MRRRTLESPEQRLFTALASAFLQSPTTDDNNSGLLVASCKSAELLQVARTLKFPVREGRIVFHPPSAFTPTAFTQLQELKRQLEHLLVAIEEVSGGRGEAVIEAEHRQYMESLHVYNEVKDVGQALLGKLALFTGQTTRQLYPEFGLSLAEE